MRYAACVGCAEEETVPEAWAAALLQVQIETPVEALNKIEKFINRIIKMSLVYLLTKVNEQNWA